VKPRTINRNKERRIEEKKNKELEEFLVSKKNSKKRKLKKRGIVEDEVTNKKDHVPEKKGLGTLADVWPKLQT